MDSDKLERLVKDTHKLARENNALLNKLNRARLWGNIFEVVKWVVIIAISAGTYYVVQPFIDQALNLLSTVTPSIFGK